LLDYDEQVGYEHVVRGEDDVERRVKDLPDRPPVKVILQLSAAAGIPAGAPCSVRGS
jgi:hypothetical protein